MKQLYTEQDILRFLYDEMDEEEYASFFEVLCKDPEMWEVYEQMKETRDSLGTIEENPSEKNERKIMAVAREAARQMRGEGENPVPATRRIPGMGIALLSAGLLGIGIWAGWGTIQSEFLNSPPQADLHGDNSWMHSRLARMEDVRTLPHLENNNRFQLVSYSGQKVYKFTASHP